MKVLAIILFILFLILLLKVGVTAEYSEDGILLLVHAGPLKIKVLPKSDKPKKEKPKKREKNCTISLQIMQLLTESELKITNALMKLIF